MKMPRSPLFRPGSLRVVLRPDAYAKAKQRAIYDRLEAERFAKAVRSAVQIAPTKGPRDE